MLYAEKMSSLRVVCVFAAISCLLSVGAQDQVVKVSLNKRPLTLDSFGPAYQAQQSQLLQSSNEGEDIPILNFLDAQVPLTALLSRSRLSSPNAFMSAC